MLLTEPRAEQREVLDREWLCPEQISGLDELRDLGFGGGVEAGEGDVRGEAPALGLQPDSLECILDLALEKIELRVALDPGPNGCGAASFLERTDPCEG